MAGETPHGSKKREDTFAGRLRRFREGAGLTQEELASRAGLSAKAISVLERGERRRPYPHTVRSLADALALEETDRAALFAAIPGRKNGPPDLAGDAPTLPVPPTALIGRERELREVRSLLLDPGARLVTLTGTGGVGKTRLSLEAARQVADEFRDDAAFVELAPLRESALVLPTIALALGLREAEAGSLRKALRSHLRERRLLLVLDNFEHVTEAAPEVADLIEACPGLVVLATSRAPLRIRGELEYPIPPLDLPTSTANPDAGEVMLSPSGRLFVERARAAAPAFELTDGNVATVAAICWRLAGLPLALELAAAKVRFLDPADLLSRLDRALSTGWARDLPERQQTMQATLDWSYDLLGEAERRLFRRLGVFAGGFSLEAAEAVGAEGDPAEVLDALGELVEQSLILAQSAPGGGVRYRMLEPVRQYALEISDGGGDAVRRHAEFFLALAERAHPELRGPRQVEWIGRLETEDDNLRAAMAWALDEDLATAARLGRALWVFWWIRGHQDEGRRWMETLLERDWGRELPPGLRGWAENVAAATSYMQGDFEACERHARESLRLALLARDGTLEGHSYIGAGLVALAREDFGETASLMEKAVPLFDAHGEEGMGSITRIWLGTTYLSLEDAGRADSWFDEGLALARRMGDRLSIYIALYNLARLALDRGDNEAATALFEEGAALSAEVQDRANLAYCMEGLAVISVSRGDADRAARLLGAGEAMIEQAGAPVYNYYRGDRSPIESAVAQARDQLGAGTFEEARAWGRSLTTAQAAAYASSGSTAPPTTDT